MDGNTFHAANSYLAEGFVASAATMTACAAYIASFVRRRTVRRSPFLALATRPTNLVLTAQPLLSGQHRGRNVSLTLHATHLTAVVEVHKGSGVTAAFSSRNPPRLTWVPPNCRRKLGLLQGDWAVTIHAKSVTLLCPADTRPESLGFALELACDLANATEMRHFMQSSRPHL